ncbi:MAG TPA: BREX system ATP-binding domain-containing protein, partial [Solirubrobacterales bacterium]|nr:BREX system ATP-binding domain-containing protein [Solirubrobacterales bacterium]
MQFAQLLKRLRERADLTQEELAARAGLGVNTIGNLERGVNRTPQRSTLLKLSDGLGLDEEEAATLAAAARPPARRDVVGGFLGARPTSPLVGRDREMERLLAATAAVEEGEGRLLLVVGEAGIGKTRLAQEVSVHAWERGFLVAAGRCYEGRRGIPYFPLLELLGQIQEVAPGPIDGRPDLATLLAGEAPGPGPADAQRESLRLLRATTELVKDLAATRPVALLIDDLHWADGATIGVLAHLARHTRGDRVLLLATSRDVEHPRDQPLPRTLHELDRERLIERIPCGRLGAAATVELVEDLLPTASADLRSRIVEQTDGNPFFVVEAVRAVAEHGEEAPIPAGVRAAVLDRVESIGPRARSLLEAASVLGPAFPVGDLLGVATTADLDAVLAAVEADRVLRQTDGGYSFDHALTQQTLYTEMSARRRRDLHLAAAAQLEPPRIAEIGWHLMRGGDDEGALPHLIRAGERAEALFANDEASGHYGDALAIAERLGDAEATATVLGRLGGTLVTVARYDEGLALLERAADSDLDTTRLAQIERRIAEAHFRRGTSTQGAERMRERLAMLDRPDLDPAAADAVAGLYGALARLRFARLEYDRCLDAARRVAELASDE